MGMTDSDRTDSSLAVLAQKGDKEAFSKLVETYQRRIYSFCYQFFRDADVAAELTQEAFLRAFRHIRRYDRKRKFSTWLYSVARNICIDEKRKLDRGKTVPLQEVNPDSLHSGGQSRHLKDPSQISLHLEERVVLEQAVTRLPEKYRTVIILCYFQELPYQEVADVMGLSLNLVKVRIFRAKKMLLEILGEGKGI